MSKAWLKSFYIKKYNRSNQNSAFPAASWIFLHIPSLDVWAPGRWQALNRLWRARAPSLWLVTQQVPLSECQTPSPDRRAPGLGPWFQVAGVMATKPSPHPTHWKKRESWWFFILLCVVFSLTQGLHSTKLKGCSCLILQLDLAIYRECLAVIGLPW